MSEHLTPEQRELVAGYVLGDLEPEELERFQVLLHDHPGVEAEVLNLQEALGMMPYGLASPEVPAVLKSNILGAATRPTKKQQHNIRWGWWVSGLAAAVAIALGIQNWQLRHQLTQQQPALSDTASYNWQDFAEVLADHRKSLTRHQGPADLATQNIAEVRSAYAQQMALPTELPQLQQAQLLGGSFCDELSQTKGLRLSYQIPSGATVSFYQLLQSDHLPAVNESGEVLQNAEGLNVIVWGTQDYLYLLVGDAPLLEMQQLRPQSV